MAKPDDRSDNVDKIEFAIANTMQNQRDAEDFVKAHEDEMNAEDKADIRDKNKRRQHAIEGFRDEIRDEADYQSRH